MDASSWTPVNETASDIWNERSIMDGLFLGTVAYGIHLTLFIWAFHLLCAGKRTKRDYFFLFYISTLFALGTIVNATNIKFGEMTFIDDRNYPGGPNAFFVQQSIDPVAVICIAAGIASSWLQDGLLLYRLWIISQRIWYIMALPSLMFLVSIVLSIFLIVELSQPNITLWSKIAINLAIPYGSISITLNVIITTYIGARLLYMRYRMRLIPANTIGGLPYVSITSMLVESAALNTINGLIFLIIYATNSSIQNLAFPTLAQTQSIAPLLIILRVTQGRAWSEETVSKLTSGPIQFKCQDSKLSSTRLGESTGEMHHSHGFPGSSTYFGTIDPNSHTTRCQR